MRSPDAYFSHSRLPVPISSASFPAFAGFARFAAQSSSLATAAQVETLAIFNKRSVRRLESQRVASKRRQICTGCKASLGFEARPLQLGNVERWVLNVVLDLIGICADPDQAVIPPLDLDEIRKRIPTKNHSLPTSREFQRICAYSREGRVSIETLLNICAIQHVDARTLLLSPLEASAPPLLADSTEFIYLETRRRAAHMLGQERAATVVNDLLQRRSRPLLPLPTVLRVLGVRAGPQLSPFKELFATYQRRFAEQSHFADSVRIHTVVRTAVHLVSTRMNNGESVRPRDLAAAICATHGNARRISNIAVRAAARLLKVQREVDAAFLTAKNWQRVHGSPIAPTGRVRAVRDNEELRKQRRNSS